MTVYYQLENMLVAGFKSQDEYDRYQALKRDYEGESEDYSFSIREITNQLEIICQTSENDLSFYYFQFYRQIILKNQLFLFAHLIPEYKHQSVLIPKK